MGREWYNGGRSTCSSRGKKKSNETNGCVTALYHFFHFHHFYFPSRHHHHQPSSVDSHSRNPEGLVAPRNSLDLTEESPLSTNYKLENESLNIHVGRKNSTLRALLVDTSSNNCNSPRTKTPNVVARLMGLDLLPDNLDLNRSSRYSVRGHKLSGNGSGTRSLPDSPRISSDSENRRLSLQLNRENKHEEFARRRLKELKQDEQTPSPRHNGRHIKERVTTRKFGMDITNLLENKRAGAAQNRIEHSRFSQKENTTRTNPSILSRQDQISQQPKKVTFSKDFKQNQQSLRPNGWKKAESESKFSPHPTPNNRNKQRKAFISISTPSKSSDCCDLIKKKQCKKISVASSGFSATERPRKQIKRAEEPERKADATICSGQMYKYEKKLPQEPPSSNFYDSTTITATLANVRDTKKDITGTKKLEEEQEWVIAEIERQIVDALVQEMVETTSFIGLNANAVRFARH
ncbi:DUF3741-associated sequence motif [Arabidopsis thaliana x Arabidopsis arenosa]|uniref:DUF3741-associated sequence motif n=1 Tax=Arabidopsis thaliana x Arabidopsis arenosa TaxID=1240361 RepID=A0A8T1Y2Y9_9BRAS|nr:DUF3741-associated sequence motif [Arabidopsis thaliana x Arabidopsis arenosa]